MAKKNQTKQKSSIAKIGMKIFALIASVGAAVYVFRDKIKKLPIYKDKLEEPIEDIQEKIEDISDSIEDKVEEIQEKIEDKMEDSDAATAVKEKAVVAKDFASENLKKAKSKAKDLFGRFQEKLSKDATASETESVDSEDDFEDVFSNIDTSDREYVSLNITDDTDDTTEEIIPEETVDVEEQIGDIEEDTADVKETEAAEETTPEPDAESTEE